MARISLEELVELLKTHPKYRTKWELGVPAEQALHISFGVPAPGTITSAVFDAIDGHHLALDRDQQGRIWGIEIL